MPPSKHAAAASFAEAKYAANKFIQGKRCQWQPSASHTHVTIHVYKQD